MNEPNDGGNAFPIAAPVEALDRYWPVIGDAETMRKQFTGMTLRDWFAGMALQGMLAADTQLRIAGSLVADAAYEQADAMIKARQVSQPAATPKKP